MHKMKDSGVPWIGEIPEGWEVGKLSRLITFINGYAFSGGELTQENEIPVIRIGDIHELKVDYTTCLRFNNLNNLDNYIVRHNDIVIAMSGATTGKIAFILNPPKAYINQRVGIIRCVHEPRFVFYLLQLQQFLNYIELLGAGSAQPNISAGNIQNFFIPILSFGEQQRIADFLDAKCAHIDDTIAKEKELIEKLKEYRQSVITEAVTKGLTPSAPMKDSGIDWIGKIPEHWGISKIKFEFDNLDSLRQPISASDRGDIEGEYDYYGASGVIDKIDKYIFNEPLLLIGEDGANLVMRNLPLIYKAKGKFWVNNHAHILRPRCKNILEYWFYSLECLDLTNYISGSAQPKLTQEKLANIPLVVPSKNEQQEIAAYLNEKTALIDHAISQKEQLVEKFNQYKKSLTYEVVTGKLEV